MNPAKRLATEVLARMHLPGARWDDLESLCRIVIGRTKTKKKLGLPGKSRAARREEIDTEDAAVRAVVFARAFRLCEVAGCTERAAEHDHFWGRARDRSAEGSWALCRRHHLEKTTNAPSRIWWLRRFMYRAMRFGYGDQVNRAIAAIDLESAQHPEHQEKP